MNQKTIYYTCENCNDDYLRQNWSEYCQSVCQCIKKIICFLGQSASCIESVFIFCCESFLIKTGC